MLILIVASSEVHKAVQISTGRAVALKRILMHNEKEGMPVTALREIKILKAMKHPCVVDIVDMFVVRSKFQIPSSFFRMPTQFAWYRQRQRVCPFSVHGLSVYGPRPCGIVGERKSKTTAQSYQAVHEATPRGHGVYAPREYPLPLSPRMVINVPIRAESHPPP